MTYSGIITATTGSNVDWNHLESFVISVAEHQNMNVITIVGGKSECNSSRHVQELVIGLSRKLPTRRLHGNDLIKRNVSNTPAEVPHLLSRQSKILS
jgi:hypothetical protein